MKAIVVMVLALVLLLSLPATLQAALLYSTNANTITITGSNPKATGTLVIPSAINGLPVTSIGEWAFSDSGLTTIMIPNSVTSIGEGTFYGCTGLTRVTIPSSVLFIGESALADCNRLVSVTVDVANPAYSSSDNVLFNRKQTSLVAFPAGKTGVYTLPSSVTSIGYYAFSDSGLTSITIPGSVTSIADGAFYGSDFLTNVTILNGVTSIGESAFEFCKALKSVTIPSSVTSIADYAFYSCGALTSVTIPSSVSTISDFAFEWCDGLTGVYFLGNAPTRGIGVFNGAINATVYYIEGKTGWGSTFAGRPTAKWVPVEPPVPTVNTLVVQVSPFIQNPSWASILTNTVPQSGAQQFYRMRASVVEVTVDLKNPSWTPVATNNLPSSGSQLFYRLVAR